MVLVLTKQCCRWVPETAAAADPPASLRWLMQHDLCGDAKASGQVSHGCIRGDDQIAVGRDCSGVAQSCGGVEYLLAKTAALRLVHGLWPAEFQSRNGTDFVCWGFANSVGVCQLRGMGGWLSCWR